VHFLPSKVKTKLLQFFDFCNFFLSLKAHEGHEFFGTKISIRNSSRLRDIGQLKRRNCRQSSFILTSDNVTATSKSPNLQIA